MVKVITPPALFPGSPVSSATFSDDMVYRYVLTRAWAGGNGNCTFICLNPSTADAFKNDPTVTRCIGYAKKWGYKSFTMLNAFAVRSTDPAGLMFGDPIGPDNDRFLREEAGKADLIVAAWGTHCRLGNRDEEMKEVLRPVGKDIYCLGTTMEGFPKHPLYLKGDVKPYLYMKCGH